MYFHSLWVQATRQPSHYRISIFSFIHFFGTIGIGLMAYRLSWRSFVVQLMAGFFVLYLLVAMFIWPHPDHRYILPLILPLLIGVAYTLSILYEKFRTKSWVRPAGVLLVAILAG